MDTTRIKMKVGENELDAEGSQDFVQAQVTAFQAMISSIAREPLTKQSEPARNGKENNGVTPSFPHIPIEKIAHLSGRVVSLTAIPTSVTDAALLIMLGQKDLRNNTSVTGQEIGDGLAQSGREVPRVDRIMEQALTDQFVLKSGIKRGTRYRLTNVGLSKALAIAKELIESLP